MIEETKEVKKTCWLAKLSMFGIIGVLVIIIAMAFPPLNRSRGLFEHMIIPVMLLLSLLFAVVSLIRIKCSKNPLKGTKTAIIVIVGALCIFLMRPALSGPHREYPGHVICATNLKGLGTSIMICASDHDDTVFVESNWCDILIMEVDGDPACFMCKNPMAVYGESSYAINKNALGKKFSKLPADMVLVFETNLGRKDTERTRIITERPSFSKYPVMGEIFKEAGIVYLDRWNQVGGPEDLTVDNHGGRGCNVLFGGGHVEFVKAEDIDKLRWTVE